MKQFVYINEGARVLMCDNDPGKMDCISIDPDVYTNESCLFTSAREPSTFFNPQTRTSQEFQTWFKVLAEELRKLKLELKQPIEKMEKEGVAKEDILQVTAGQETTLRKKLKMLMAGLPKAIAEYQTT